MVVSCGVNFLAAFRMVALVLLIVTLLNCGQPVESQQSRLPRVLYGPAGIQMPAGPSVPDGPLAEEVVEGLEMLFDRTVPGGPVEAIEYLGGVGDPRVLWLLTDLFSFSSSEVLAAIRGAFVELTKTEIAIEGDGKLTMSNRLIAWDIPSFSGYRDYKWRLFQFIEPLWEPFFKDVDSAIDWRLVSWSGVAIDDRIDATPESRCLRGCIPAIDNPVVTGASSGDWYPDERLVFGVVVNGEARAYPKNMMEVHELVNDTLGGRHLGITYCTLCGSAQAYFTDDIEGFNPLLRTSGLLSRSNKLMYDRNTFSAVETATGIALSGPLHDAGVVLTPVAVVTSTWGDWKQAHSETTILNRFREYPLDPLSGRDDNGPIFPVGDVDQRLSIQEHVLGVDAPDGPIAFPVTTAVNALKEGEAVNMGEVRLKLEGSGLRAFIGERDTAAHEAFWFAWSQFNQGTRIWRLDG